MPVDEVAPAAARVTRGEEAQALAKRLWGLVGSVLGRPMGIAGLAVILFFVGMAVLARPLAGPFPTYSPPLNLGPTNSGPIPGFPLGTDQFGRNNFALLVYGSQVSLLVGFTASLAAMVIGTSIGVSAGYFGRWVDRGLSMVINFFLAIPWLPFVLFLVLVLGRGFVTTVTAIAVVSWPTTARILRSQTLSLKTRGYVERARAVGSGDGHIIVRHILPVLTPLIFANLILTVSYSIFTESFLAFFGLEDPAVSSWGTMIQLSYMNADFLRGAWWSILPPGICITALVLAFGMLGFVTEEALNPRLRARSATGRAQA